MIVWRDSKVAQGPFTCPAQAGVRPSWFPLGQEGIVIFDEQEHPQLTASPAHVFPAETQKIHVGGSALPTTFDAGWMYLDLNNTVAAAGSNPPVDPAAAQGVGLDLLRQQRGRQYVQGGRARKPARLGH